MADENDLNIGINVNPTGAETGSRRAKAAVKGIADGTKDLEGALRRLRSSVDPAFAAMEKYNKAHADNLALLRADVITRKEYNAGMKAAKAAMDAEIQSIERRSAAGRAAAAEEKALRQQQKADARAAAQAEAAAIREAATAKRAAAREASAEAKRLATEERAAVRQAAQEARQAAQEKQQQERAAAAEARRAASEQRRQEKAEAREAARVVREAAREKARAEKDAAREAAAAQREAKRSEREGIRSAEAEVKRAAREKAAAEREASREAAQAEREAKRQQREATRTAAAEAKAAARERAAAEKEAARASKEAAAEVERLARAERQAAQAATELRASIDPAFAAQERYNQTMRSATQLLMQNKLQQGEWNKIQAQARAQMDLNVRSLGRQNAMYVQLGYQAQDVTASLASGINPLVILAQQGGQTAAALSTMGGTAGKVAAFFAGPWGAAIIGATLLLGYLWESMSTGEEATKDLMNAEDRRKMTVKELTEAIREYTKAQKEANDTTLQGAINQAYATAEARNRIFTEMAEAQQKLAAAQDNLQAAMSNPQAQEAVIGLSVAVWLAERRVNSLKDAYGDAVEAAGEARAAYVQSTSEMSENEIREQMERQTALEVFRREWKAAGQDAAAQARVTAQYQGQLSRIQTHYNALKEAETRARRENARAARDEEKATFQSQRDAIGRLGKSLQGKGYAVDEGLDFGGITKGAHRSSHINAIDVNIPGAGNEASNEVYRRQMDEEVLAAQAAGYRVLWNGKVYEPYGGGPTRSIPMRTGTASEQHTNHAHFEAPASLVGKPAGSGLAGDLVRQAEALAEEERRIAEDRLRDRVGEMEFEQELNRENLNEVLRIQNEKIVALSEFYGAESREVMNAMRERVRMERVQARELLEEQRRGIEQRLNLMLEGLNREKMLRDLNTEDRNAVVDFAEQQGAISPQEALIMKQAILEEEYSMQRAHEEAMYQLRLQAMRDELNLQNLPAEARARINEEIEREEQQHLTRMAEMHGTYTNQVNAMNRQAAALNTQKWREFASSWTGSMTQAFQGFWTRSLTLQQAFINMADQQVYRLAEMGAKALEDWIMQQVGMTGVQQAQEAARVASTTGAQAAQTAAVAGGTTAQTGIKAGAAAVEQGIQAATTAAAIGAEAIKTGAAVTGAATQTAVGAAAGMAEIGTRAATSAAGAFSSTVVIPFIGPVAAPVAAAAALAAVLGFGALISSSGGQGEVPRDGQLSMLHKKETVLPAWIAEPMRQMFVSPRSSGGMMGAASSAGSSIRDAMTNNSQQANFYYQPKHTNMGASFDTLLRQDGRSLRKWIKNEVRNGGLKLK